MKESVKKIRNTIKQWSVVQRCKASVAWCFRCLCFIARWLWERFTFNNVLIFLIFAGGGVMLTLAGILLLEAFSIRWIDVDLGNSYGLLQALIWSIGGVGAAIGLWFANQRQKTLSEQVQAQVDQAQAQTDQSFNDRLGRGVELLANEKNMVMCCAGIRVLVDLAHNASEAQKPIVGNIIYDFFHDKLKVDILSRKRLEREVSQDVQNALNFLIGLSFDEIERLLPEQIFLGRLNFRYLDLTHLRFNSERVENIDLSSSHIGGITFERKVIIENVHFAETIIEDAGFFSAEIKNSDFAKAEIINSHFHICTIEESTFINTRIEKTDLDDDTMRIRRDSVKFVGGDFCDGTIKVSSTSGFPYFVGVDLSGTSFDFDDSFDDRTDINKYFKLCYYRKGERPLPKMDASREHEVVGGMCVFVLPKEDSKKEYWSGQPAPEWVAVEVAQWRLEYIKSLPSWQRDEKMIRKIESKLERAEIVLHGTQEALGLPKKTPKPPTL